MHLMRSVTSLRVAKRQAVLAQWQQSGQCVQCFHASHRAAAEEKGSSNELPRQSRLSRISAEVSKVRGTRGAQRADDREPGFSSEVVQTRARVLKPDEDMENKSRKEQHAEPPQAPKRKLPRPDSSLKEALKTAVESERISYTPQTPTNEGLLQAGYGVATPVGKNYAGLIADRLATVDPSFAAPHLRTEAHVHRQMVTSQPIMQLAEKPRTKNVRGAVRRRVRHELVSRLIHGKLWENGDLSGVQKEDWAAKAPWLDSTLNSLIMNGSYTKRDVEDFKERVLKFMPALAAAGAKADPKKAATKTA